MRPKSLEKSLVKRIDGEGRDVFLRSDFNDLGGYNQVGRVLKQLVDDGRLIKISQGVYARAKPSIIDSKPIPVGGLTTLREALGRLGIETAPSRLQQANIAGQTTQVPTGRVVAVNKRVRRKIGYNGINLSFERAGPGLR